MPDVNPVLSPEELAAIKKRIAGAEETATRKGGMSDKARVVADDIHALLRHVEALQQRVDSFRNFGSVTIGEDAVVVNLSVFEAVEKRAERLKTALRDLVDVAVDSIHEWDKRRWPALEAARAALEETE